MIARARGAVKHKSSSLPPPEPGMQERGWKGWLIPLPESDRMAG